MAQSSLSGYAPVQQLAEGFPALLRAQWTAGGDAALLPIGIFATLHAVRVAYDVRKGMQLAGRQPLAQELFAMLTFSFGGAILTALLLGRTQMWLENSTTLPLYAGVYLLMARAPGDVVYRALRSLSPVSDVFLAGVDGLIRGYGVTAAGVDLVRKTLKGQPVADSLVAWIVIGTVMGSGGGIIDDVLQFSRPTWSLRAPTMFKRISLDVRVSFCATVGYILTTHAWSFAERAPGFPLSALLDRLLALVPHLSDQEAHLISGLLCSAVLSTAAHFRAAEYSASERAAAALALRKKNDAAASSNDEDNEEEDDDDDDEEDDIYSD
ncbi:hypothetical protein H4R18_004032 [Coemansia javaensis]|uniref:Uncharacterized protein n=1 Tax=Coemansia javaensis TaxID=2761396 RepID=A0A9W8HAL9_9FUNG|nr:hypothetical protein H4R18_004032 [Coemansia javaensis]